MPHHNLLTRLLCLPLPVPRRKRRPRARPQISRPYNVQSGYLCSYRRGRRSSSFACAGEEEEPVSPAWTVAAYERDSFCLVMEEEVAVEEEVEVEVVEVDSPTLPARCGCSWTGPLSMEEVEVQVQEEVVEEVQVGSIDFSGSYYGRLGREWVS